MEMKKSAIFVGLFLMSFVLVGSFVFNVGVVSGEEFIDSGNNLIRKLSE